MARTLRQIEEGGEKVIIFCELRDIQLLLAHYIHQEFRVRPDIINGDTEAAASAADSRQKRIKRFQAQSGFRVIILSPIAVGFGVKFKLLTTLFISQGRGIRRKKISIGQTKSVYVLLPSRLCQAFHHIRCQTGPPPRPKEVAFRRHA